MRTIAITGGSGFVGQHLARLLVSKGYRVRIYSRSKQPARDGLEYAAWNPDEKTIDIAALEDVEAVVHLAGASVTAQRWTAAYKAEILRSRVDATRFLIEQLRAYAPACTTFIAASATGFYGPDRGGDPFTETAPPYTDFLAQTCRLWEEASLEAAASYRTVIFRIGIVLGRDGGAYPQLTAPMKFGVAPILGSGRQVVSWIHLDDLSALLAAAVNDKTYAGIYNAVAPTPVTNRLLMQALAKAKGGLRIPAPVPPFVLRIIMGESSIEVLKSCTASAEKIETAGFRFSYPEIGSAASALA